MVAYNNLFDYYILYCVSLDDIEALYEHEWFESFSSHLVQIRIIKSILGHGRTLLLALIYTVNQSGIRNPTNATKQATDKSQ